MQEIHTDIVPLQSLFRQLVLGDLYLVGCSSAIDSQGFIKFYPSSGDVSRTPQNIHILTLQGHPEFSESIVTGLTRQIRDMMDVPTLIDYWGPKGGLYDEEPLNQEGTGRRWWKTDGVDIVSPVYWKMLGVQPSTETSEFVSKESITRVLQKHEQPSASLKSGREGKVVLSRWWRLMNSFKSFRKIIIEAIRW